MIVKDMLTPLSRDDASRAFLTAYQQLTGKLPTPAVLALLLAQSAFETGHWKSLHNFNFGNAKARPRLPAHHAVPLLGGGRSRASSTSTTRLIRNVTSAPTTTQPLAPSTT